MLAFVATGPVAARVPEARAQAPDLGEFASRHPSQCRQLAASTSPLVAVAWLGLVTLRLGVLGRGLRAWRFIGSGRELHKCGHAGSSDVAANITRAAVVRVVP
jgi:hypothetical protein